MLYKSLTSWLVAVAILSIGATALAVDTKLDSKITSVTVFNDRALVNRTVEVDLAVGSHSITIPDIPLIADEQSIRASATGENMVIQGLKHAIVSMPFDSARIEALNHILDTLYNHQLAALNDRKSVLEMQKSMLDQLIANAGKTLSDDMTKVAFDAKNWEQAYTFISRNLSFVVDSLRAIGLESAGISNRCSKLEAELNRLKSDAMQQTRHVTIDVEVESAGRSHLSIAYLVTQASWSPIYNARLIDSDSVELSYFGQVTQNTGEDWEDVKLTLSTASPNRIMFPGELSAKTLATREGFDIEYGNSESGIVQKVEHKIVIAERDLLRVTETADFSQIRAEDIKNMPVATVSELLRLRTGVVDSGRGLVAVNSVSTSLSTSFIVLKLETIPSGEQSTRTTIAQWVLDGDETLVARPQNFQSVFRFMKMKNTTGAPLLPGTINLFAQNDYIGRFNSPYLVLPDEDFGMPFGVDDGIEIKREINDRLNFVDGDKRGHSETVTITLVNKSGFERTVELEEALFTSNDSRVKIDFKSIVPKPIETDRENKAKWQVKLAPSGKETVSISYKIEYPHSIQLSGL